MVDNELIGKLHDSKIIQVFMPCSDCLGEGKVISDTCPSCKGEGKQEIKSEHPGYAKYYRMTLKSKIEAAIEDNIAAERYHQKSLENYDFYVGLLRKLDAQEAAKAKKLEGKL